MTFVEWLSRDGSRIAVFSIVIPDLIRNPSASIKHAGLGHGVSDDVFELGRLSRAYRN